MFVGGIYAIVFAKVPPFLLSGGKYKVEGLVVRWLGVLLILPLSISFFLLDKGFIISSGLLTLDEAIQLELILVFGAAILFVVLVLALSKGTDEIKIRKALLLLLSFGFMLVALGGFCFAAIPILFCDSGPASECYQMSFSIVIGAALVFVLSLLPLLTAIALKRKNN